MLEVEGAFTEGERASLFNYGLASVRRRCFSGREPQGGVVELGSSPRSSVTGLGEGPGFGHPSLGTWY